MTESLLADQFDRFVKDVAAVRGKSEAEIRALVDRAFFQGETRSEAGLVDECLYEDQLRDLFRRQGRPGVLIPVARYARTRPVLGRARSGSAPGAALRRRAPSTAAKAWPGRSVPTRSAAGCARPAKTPRSRPSSCAWTAPAAPPWPRTSSRARSS